MEKKDQKASELAVPLYSAQDDLTLADEYENLQLETHPLNLLFFLKKVDDEEILESMNSCVRYILEKQKGTCLVNKVYAEDWVISKLPEVFLQQKTTIFEKWPPTSATNQTTIDYIITIGGDGTILTLLRLLQDYEKTRILPPIITFSQGSLNYLGNFDIKEYKKVLEATVVKQASFEKICVDLRMRLQLTMHKNADPTSPAIVTIKDPTISNDQQETVTIKGPMEFQSLNEVTIMRKSENMSQIEIFINNVLLTVLQGDGLLISTPTGSTAYNLSCGGSIVHYSAQVICVTPIAPHSLSFRPLILPANVNIKIRIPSTARSSTKITIDGHTNLDLNVEDYLVITRSPFSVPFVRWSTENQDHIWSMRLYKQLKWNKHIVQKPFKKLVVVDPKL